MIFFKIIEREPGDMRLEEERILTFMGHFANLWANPGTKNENTQLTFHFHLSFLPFWGLWGLRRLSKHENLPWNFLRVTSKAPLFKFPLKI